MKPRCGIYLIRHKESGKGYVGQSKDIKRRFSEHRRGVSGVGILSHAIAKYGWDSFETTVLEECELAGLDHAEDRWVKQIGTMSPAGYNLLAGGQAAPRPCSDEVRRKISVGIRRSMTAEVRAKMSAAKKGIPKTAEHRAKIGAAQRNPKNIARMLEHCRNQTPETREKIAASKRGKKWSAEWCANISKAKSTPESRAKSAEVCRNWVRTPEVRAKMSASAKLRCARQAAERAAKVAA